MQLEPLEEVLALLSVQARQIEPLKVVEHGNSSWRVEDENGHPLVLRRYHDRSSVEDVLYEHAVIKYLAGAGWAVPEPLGGLIEWNDALYCATRFVPGSAADTETPTQQGQRGRDLARLHLALRGVDLGQRPGWRPQHTATTVHTDIDWDACLQALRRVDSSLAKWAAAAADSTAEELSELGASDLPVIVVHGDFASWNVHYSEEGALTGVIDFGLTHLDSRPYELAIARTYRAPEMIKSYRAELDELGWPLTPLEEAAIDPIHRAFRVDMAAWFIDSGARTGSFDISMIRSQLQRTGSPAP